MGDLARFTAAVHSGSLISRRWLQEMITPHVPFPDGQGTSDGWVTCDGYGYGQFIGRIAGHAASFHPDDNPGYQSLAVWLPVQAACVVILANDEAADTGALLRQLVPVALETTSREITAVRFEGEPGLGQESVDEGGPVLDVLEPVPQDGGQQVHVAGGEVAQAVLHVRPDALGWVEIRGIGRELDDGQPVPAGASMSRSWRTSSATRPGRPARTISDRVLPRAP